MTDELKEDVKRYVVKHQDKFQSVDEIFNANLKLCNMRFKEIFTEDEMNDHYGKLYSYKRKAQLKLNLFRNFDFFKNCTVLNCEIEKPTNQKPSKPDIKEVIEDLVPFVECFLQARYCEFIFLLKGKKITIEKSECSSCEKSFKNGFWHCENCYLSISEFIRKWSVTECDKPDTQNKHYEIKEVFEKIENEVINNHQDKNKDEGNIQETKICENCGVEVSVADNLCEACYTARYEEWLCCYPSCGAINKPNDKYCKKCGIVRMTNPVYNLSVICYDKNYMCTKVWICKKCDTINKGEKKETCPKCDPGMRDTGKDKIINDEPLQGEMQKINEGDKWKCSDCQSVNDHEFLSCRQCNKARMDIWRCIRCTADNKILIKNCVACEWKRYCERCKKNESTSEGICAECMLTEETTWFCPYRLCGNKNYGQDKYCIHCGLDRSFSGRNEGFVTRCLNGKNESVRICKYQLCSAINDQNYRYCNQCGLEQFLSFGRGESVDRRVNGTKDRVWICSYQMCQNINNINVDFCHHCGLYRYFGCGWKTAIKRHFGGHMYQVWICSDCSNINALDQPNCTAQSCHSERNIYYKWCMYCSDGKISMDEHWCSSCKCLYKVTCG